MVPTEVNILEAVHIRQLRHEHIFVEVDHVRCPSFEVAARELLENGCKDNDDKSI